MAHLAGTRRPGDGMQSFAEVLSAARRRGPERLAVAGAADTEVLAAVDLACRSELGSAILIGEKARIEVLAAGMGMPLAPHQVIDVADQTAAAQCAAALVARGEAGVLVKGMLPTSVLLRALLDRQNGLRTGQIMSHVALFEIPGFPRLLAVTDAGMNVTPDLAGKAAILANGLQVARALGWERPRAAVLAAAETTNPDLPGVLDAVELSRMAEGGSFGQCHVEGPLSLDLAISAEAARRKQVMGKVAGQADLLLVPDLNAGNILYKALVCLARAKVAAVVVGARAPVVVASRADSAESKLFSIALAILVQAGQEV